MRMLLVLMALLLGVAPVSASVRFAYLESAETGVNGPLVIETIALLSRTLQNEPLTVAKLTEAEMRSAVEHNEVDLFLASSAFYRQMLSNSARDIATAQSTKAMDPNHSEGSVFLVRGERLDVMRLDHLRGRRLALSREFGFSGYAAALGELRRRGISTDDFFKEILELSADPRTLLDALRERRVDAVVLPTCLLEWFTEQQTYDTAWLRALEPRQEESLACVHSTALYPNLTLASLPTLPSAHSRRITQALLNMKPVDGNLFWSIATDFQGIDNLLRRMEMDPWAKDRQGTIVALIQKYRLYLGILLGVLVLAAAHGLLLSALVRRRTAELSNALTEQRRLQQQARTAARRMERLQKIGVIGQLGSLFAHELGQPLNAVICYSFGLQKLLRQTPEQKELVQRAVDEIRRQAERANAIVEKVRDYVRTRGAHPQAVDWTAVLQEAVKNFKMTQSFDGRIEFKSSGRVRVAADALELELIALNLIRNAAEAQTGVRHPFIRLSLGVEGRFGELSVTDNGAAIDDEKFQELLDSRQSSKPEGLGLGLSIVRTLVEIHAGRTVFTRSPSGGLKVVVQIPLADEMR